MVTQAQATSWAANLSIAECVGREFVEGYGRLPQSIPEINEWGSRTGRQQGDGSWMCFGPGSGITQGNGGGDGKPFYPGETHPVSASTPPSPSPLPPGEPPSGPGAPPPPSSIIPPSLPPFTSVAAFIGWVKQYPIASAVGGLVLAKMLRIIR